MSNRPSLDDYIDVAERLQDFKDAHPDGCLQTISWEVVEIGNRHFVVYRAAAYRHPDDPRPGHGVAWEPFPGATPYTRNSELMNAETAAWGRAIVALGLAANRRLASRQEVRARIEEQEAAPVADNPMPAVPPESVKAIELREPLSDDRVRELRKLTAEAGWDANLLAAQLRLIDVEVGDDLAAAIRSMTTDQADHLADTLRINIMQRESA